MSRRRTRARLSFANVTSSIALFVALGGGAYAATGGFVGANGAIRVCVSTNGSLTAVKSAKTCKKHRTTLTLDQQGRPGINGALGKQGPAGVQGLQGVQGPPGPSTGPAGGALTGSYPNPGLAAGAVGPGQIGQLPVAREDKVPAAADGIPNNTSTLVCFAGVQGSFDPTSMGLLGTSGPCSGSVVGFSAPIAGTYQVSGGLAWQGNATGERVLELTDTTAGYDVAANETGVNPDPIKFTIQTASGLVHLSAGDVIEMKALQNSGGSLNLVTGDTRAFISMAWVSP